MKALLIKFGFPILKLYWFIFRPKTEGVKCAVISHQKIVLVRHSYGGHLWALPGGGIKRGESIEEAAIREIKEELGLVVHTVEVVGDLTSTSEYKIDHIHCCIAKTNDEILRVDRVELLEVQWFAYNSLPEDMSTLSAKLFSIIKPKL